MRIAFASCLYATEYPTQNVWDKLLLEHAEKKIDALLLMGDQVYPGYGPSDGKNKPQRMWPQVQFASTFYALYKQQYEILSFRKFLEALPKVDIARDGASAIKGVKAVHMVWDDHDFGYNNSFGRDPTFRPESKAESRQLFMQFRNACRELPATYPAQPPPATLPAPFEGVDETGILPQTGFPKQIKLFMLDTRYDAGDPKTGGERLFRPEKWIETMSAIRAHDGLSIVCTGRPLTEPSGLWHEQSWLNFAELPAFLQLCREKKNIIVLSGDIHKNLKLVHDNTYEFYSSAAAQTGEENFGLLDLDADVIRASLYKKTSAGKRARRHIEEIIPTADIGTARFGV